MPDLAWNVRVVNQFAFVACDSAGLQIIDISDPANPSIAAYYDTPGASYDLDIAGQYAYIADFSSLQIIDISDPLSPRFTAEYPSSYLLGVDVHEGIAYLACGYHSPVIEIVDVSNPAEPDSISGISFLGGAFSLRYSNGHLSVLSNETEPYANYLRLVNVENPGNPFIEASIRIPGDGQIASYVVVADSFAYIADRQYGLQIADIADPADPMVIGYYDTPGDATGVFVANGYAYVADYFNGVLMIDVHDPENPGLIAGGPTDGPAVGIFATDEFIFATDRLSLVIFRSHISSVESDIALPSEISVPQNYPNPFNTSTIIRYYLPRESNVRIEIYDILGRRIEMLVCDNVPEGYHQLTWDSGKRSSGVYYYFIESQGRKRANAMVLIR